MEGKLTLCQFARVLNNGTQFDALGGGIRTISSPQFPTPVMLSILVECRFSVAESGRAFPFEIKVIDQDGKAAGPALDGTVFLDPQNSVGTLFAAVQMQFLAENPQTLIYSLLVNGEEKDSVRLELRLQQQGTAPAPESGDLPEQDR